MSLILSGTDGLSDVDGTAATPAIRGTDANTGIFFPAADTIAFSEGGVESMRIASGAISGTVIATQANQEAGSSTSVLVTPGRQQFHPSAAKVWVRGNMSAGIGTSYNVSSLTDIGVGQVVVNFTVPFSAVTYALSATASSNTDIWGQQYPTAGVAAVGSCGLGFVAGSRSLTDQLIFYAIFFGDQ